MKLLAAPAGFVLKCLARIRRILKTTEASGQADLGRGVIVHEDGRIINIADDPGKIRIGDYSQIRGEILVFASGGKISIGEFTYLGPRSTIWSASDGGVTIGKRVLISMDVAIHDTDSHSTNHEQRFAQTKEIFEKGHIRSGEGIKSAPVNIGDDVWIGLGATIMRGVTIGDRSIIGAKAIVKSNVPADGFVPTPIFPTIHEKKS
jgi:acetyltransferase-like isoleucine patch superfamily enzyme